ncbi:ankyrin repeat domain-containing protein [Sphingomonas psychrotolerans]|uniref:Ankyrin repeat domain-containing protein n=1 Tax=Sphingomonas psychrotolerans TaxID=1327635 RepID=A0ABU3MZ23_9SPHN|nr:ankyrin repeat domain-containing protein [Sphingomonas psychrotolerans]MDT8757388.1 ankyrin repeat domain-containing protein [Sphingomonas psychrotolerans]
MRRFLPFSPALALMTMGCESDARADCFAPGTELPTRRDTLTDQRLGAAARDFAEALFDGDLDRAGQLLRADPGLARRRVGTHYDMLSVALATCRADAVDLVVRGGAPLDGVEDKGLPLRLALRAKDPAFAHRLLTAGASPNPAGAPSAPLRTAITLNSLGAVRMLLDFRADPNVMEATGNRPLHTALDMEHFRIAELLLDRGADPWAIDSGGANLGTAATTKMLTDSAEEAEAQRRLTSRLNQLGWPQPAPSSREVRNAAIRGEWPPASAKGAKPVPPEVLALIKANAARAN